jgi:molecular chaperone HscB
VSASLLHLIDSDDFELFALERRQSQDRAAIDARWKALQGEVHPDRHAAQGASAQRVAMQWATRVNEAYQRLKDPLRRAAYLCELNGAPIEAESNTAMPTEFLVEQLEWREALDDAGSATEVERLAARVAGRQLDALAELERLLDVERDFAAGARQVRALMFVERFAHDVDRRLEALGQ